MIDSNDPRLTAYVLGELEAAELAELEQALAASPELRTEVEAIRRTVGTLSEQLQAEQCPALTSAQREAVLRQAESPVVSRPPRSGWTWRRWAAGIVAIGTVAAIAIALLPPTMQAPRDTALNSQTAPEQDREKSRWLALPTASTESSPTEESLHEFTFEGSPLPNDGRSVVDADGNSILDRTSPDPSDSISIGLDPDGTPVDGFDLAFRKNDFSDTAPQLGGFESAGRPATPEMFGGGKLGGAGGFGGGGFGTESAPRGRSGIAAESFAENSEFDNRQLSGAIAFSDPEASSLRGHNQPASRPTSGGVEAAGASAGQPSSVVAGRVAANPVPDASRPEEITGERISQFELRTDASGASGARRQELTVTRGDDDVRFAKPLSTVTGPVPGEPAPDTRDTDSASTSSVELQLAEGTIVLKGDPTEVERTKRMLSSIEEGQPAKEGGEAEEREQLRKAIDEAQLGRDFNFDKVRIRKKENSTPQRTWRRAAATPNASRLQIGDQDELLLEGMQVNVMADGFRARVLLDLYYYNNRGQQLEGNFKLRLPNDASLYYFAFGQSTIEYTPQADHLTDKGFLKGELLRTSGLDPRGILAAREGSWTNVKEARIVPREKAAHAYSETVRRRVDPALVEWAGAGVFNARVFPLMPNKLHRIVVGYDVNLQQVGEDLVYQLDLPADVTQCMIDLNVAALPGTSADVSPETRPFTSGGRAYYHLVNPVERQVEVRFSQTGPLLLTGQDEQAGDFFATRFIPQLPTSETQTGSSRAIFLVDTSLSSRPDKFNVWLNLLETLLTKNRDSLQQFAVLFFDIENHWWKNGYSENTEGNVAELLAYCHSLSLEGATDLGQALREAAKPSWKKAEATSEPTTPDLFLLSDGALTWGEANVHRLGETLQAGETGALFAYQTGLAGTATGLLEHLTRESGGAVFSVANESEIATAATAHRQRPWRLLDVSVAGGQDLLTAGRPRFIYAGQPLLIVGRGEPDAQAIVRVKQGDVEKTLEIALDRPIESELTPRLYGQVAVGQLEDLGSSLEDVAVAYSRHFRVTQQTCSLLMLDSEADYARFEIKPEDDLFVVRSTPAADLVTKKLDELAEQLADAKASLVHWLEKMESVSGLQFKTPTALKLVIDRLPREAFEVDVPRLSCEQHDRSGVSKEFQEQLESQQLDYDAVTAEAARRFGQQGGADALRTLSSLVEQNPGDPVLTRDVAFSAIEWGLPGQAYPLLQRTVALRPFEPPTYQALAQCLAELGRADLAIIYYEVALNAQWNGRYKDVHSIVAVEYAQLLRRIANKQLTSHAPEYAHARLASLAGQLPVEQADLVITMMWNTDRTDVDLHIVEPTGEECYYEHPRTALGGQITKDVTEGFGPEMYSLGTAKPGGYKILANYYAGDNNRTQVRTKVYITIYEDFGRPNERIMRKTVNLISQKDKRELAQVVVEK